MSYDLSELTTAMHRCLDLPDWNDRRSLEITGDFLNPLAAQTQTMEIIAGDIAQFVAQTESRLEHINEMTP